MRSSGDIEALSGEPDEQVLQARRGDLEAADPDAGLDEFFGEQNDIAIGLSSMRGLRGGAYPLLTTEILPCNHFHYYVIPEGQQAIKRWATG